MKLRKMIIVGLIALLLCGCVPIDREYQRQIAERDKTIVALLALVEDLVADANKKDVANAVIIEGLRGQLRIIPETKI